jgi:hypothetical protein
LAAKQPNAFESPAASEDISTTCVGKIGSLKSANRNHGPSRQVDWMRP